MGPNDTIFLICVVIQIAVFVGLGAFITWLLVMKRIKDNERKEYGQFFWIYPLRPYRLTVDLSESIYYDYEPTSADVFSNLGSYPTIDDPVLIEIAEKLSEMSKGKSEKWRANFLLAFVQQNVKYGYTIDTYGDDPYWALPIQTLCKRVGDCKATTSLYCGLAKLMGIKVRYFVVKDHAVPGIKETTIEGRILKDGEDVWYPVETTSYMPITGAFTMSTRVRRSADIVAPGSSFWYTLVKNPKH